MENKIQRIPRNIHQIDLDLIKNNIFLFQMHSRPNHRYKLAMYFRNKTTT